MLYKASLNKFIVTIAMIACFSALGSASNRNDWAENEDNLGSLKVLPRELSNHLISFFDINTMARFEQCSRGTCKMTENNSLKIVVGKFDLACLMEKTSIELNWQLIKNTKISHQNYVPWPIRFLSRSVLVESSILNHMFIMSDFNGIRDIALQDNYKANAIALLDKACALGDADAIKKKEFRERQIGRAERAKLFIQRMNEAGANTPEAMTFNENLVEQGNYEAIKKKVKGLAAGWSGYKRDPVAAYELARKWLIFDY